MRRKKYQKLTVKRSGVIADCCELLPSPGNGIFSTATEASSPAGMWGKCVLYIHIPKPKATQLINHNTLSAVAPRESIFRPVFQKKPRVPCKSYFATALSNCELAPQERGDALADQYTLTTEYEATSFCLLN